MFSNIWNIIYDLLNILWGWPLFIFFIVTSLYIGIRTKFFQITKIKIWWSKTIGEIISGKSNRTDGEGQLTPWQSITTVLGGTIGSGNVAGVATALYSGGPGAIFWMWIVAIFGMLVKMAEVTLSVFFRKKGENGEYYGGPMYYMKSSLGKIGKILALIYGIAFFLNVVTNACAIQVSTLALSINSIFGFNTVVISIVVAIITMIIIKTGGVKKVGEISTFIVPPMIIIYFIGCLGIIIANIENLPIVLRDIFACAFGAKPIMGGVAGYAITATIAKGTSRGIFSNEAGLGTSATVHATSKTDHPIHQGMYGIFEVFVDTIIVCSLTGLSILCAGILPETTEATVGVGMAMAAFRSTWGFFGGLLLCIAVTLFCYTGYLGYYVQYRTCTESLFGLKKSRYFNSLFFIFPILASLFSTLELWSICDMVVGLLVVPNLIALIMLLPKFFRLFREYMM